MSRIFWDSNLFIYLLEDYGILSDAVAHLRERMLERGDQLVTSTFTLGEILIKPLDVGDLSLRDQYEETLSSRALVVPFDLSTARRYADIRRNRSIKAPDAIQLACAAEAKVDLFVTNDRRLQGKHISGIQFIVSLDQVPI